MALTGGARGRYVMTANEGDKIAYGAYEEQVSVALGDLNRRIAMRSAIIIYSHTVCLIRSSSRTSSIKLGDYCMRTHINQVKFKDLVDKNGELKPKYSAFAGGDGLEAAKLNFRGTSMRLSLGSAGEIARRSRGDRAEIARRSRRDCAEI